MAVASRCRPTFTAVHFDFLADVLSGLNVREQYYLDPESGQEYFPSVEAQRAARKAENERWDWEYYGWGNVRECFRLERYFHGNLEERDWPEWQVVSYHRTRRGAEIAAAYLEDYGDDPLDLRVVHGETEYIDGKKPIED